MDTITILGISLLFFYSLTTILQFYGIDTSVYAIYILFYIFIIISRFILPTTYVKLFPDYDESSISAAEVIVAEPTPISAAEVIVAEPTPISAAEVIVATPTKKE